MDETRPVIVSQPPPTPPVPITMVCPTCHQPILPEYYFCPNCGTKLAGYKPLSTSLTTQLWIYFLSIVMPALAFVVIKYWPGMKYLRSSDCTRKQIGIVALILMVASTVVITWYLIIFTEGLIQTMTGGLMGAGSLGGFN